MQRHDPPDADPGLAGNLMLMRLSGAHLHLVGPLDPDVQCQLSRQHTLCLSP